MKKFLGTLIAFSAVMAVAVGVQAAEYSAGSTTVSDGTAVVPVMVAPDSEGESADISGYIVTLTYDSSAVTPVASATADALGEDCYATVDDAFAGGSYVLVSGVVADDDETTDTLAVAWASSETVSITEAANMATVEFTVDDSVTEDVDVTVNVLAVTSDGETIDDETAYTVASGVITISAGDLGDVNNDGIINGTDVTLVTRLVNKSVTTDELDALYGASTEDRTDVNKDDIINGTDVTLITRYVNKVISSFSE